MEVTWYVEDGYVNAGPQSLYIPDNELDGLTPDEKRTLIEDYVQSDFQDKVRWVCDIEQYLEGA